MITLTTVLVSILAGCNPAATGKELLTVDFQKDKVLRYEFMSHKNIYVDWEMVKNREFPKEKERRAEYTEFLQMVVAYKPIEVNPYGLSVIEARCESISTNRTKQKGMKASKSDAITSVAGKTFTFTVGPNGKITDYSQLDNLVRQAGKESFRPRGKAGIVKEPDMIGDFIATQWFLWDSISSIANPAEGVEAGQSWKSQISLPVPMVMHVARDVRYSLSEINQTEKGRMASIKSTYSLPDKTTRQWALPYPDGTFQVSGPFGFFRNYKLLSLEGQGEELFNIDAGRTEENNQKWQLRVGASTPISRETTAEIFIEQILRMKLIEEQQTGGASVP